MILITGANGYIGSVLFRKYNFDEIILTDKEFSNNNLQYIKKHNIKYYIQDLSENINSELLDNVDKIIYLAVSHYIDNSSESEKTFLINNVYCLRNFLETITKNSISIKKFLFGSSYYIYGENFKNKVTEKTPVKPINLRGFVKQINEQMLDMYFDNVIKLRIPIVYGISPNNRDAIIIHKFIKRIIKNKPLNIYGDGKQHCNFISIEQLTLTIKKIMNSDFTGVLNLPGPDNISIKKLIKLIRQFCANKSIAIKVKNIKEREDDIKTKKLRYCTNYENLFIDNENNLKKIEKTLPELFKEYEKKYK